MLKEEKIQQGRSYFVPGLTKKVTLYPGDLGHVQRAIRSTTGCHGFWNILVDDDGKDKQNSSIERVLTTQRGMGEGQLELVSVAKKCGLA